jgi:PAS domain S-box-containing protein
MMSLATSTVVPKTRFWPSRAFRARYSLALSAVGMAVIIGAAAAYALTLSQKTALNRSIKWVEHTHQVIRSLDDVLKDADDAETGQRGFLLTEDPTYLEPFQRGSAAIIDDLQKTRDLTVDNPHQQDRLQVLQGLLQAKLLELRHTITVAQSGDRQQALEIVRTGHGKRLMDLARETVAAAQAEERNLLEARRMHWDHTEGRFNLLTLALVLSAVIGIVLGLLGVAFAGVAQSAAEDRAAMERDRLLERLDLAAIIVRDFDGTVRSWSKGCCKLFGWTAEQAVGQWVHNLLGTTFTVSFGEIQSALLRDGQWQGDLRQLRQDGSEVIILAHKVLRR